VQAGLAALWGLSFLFVHGLVDSFGWALAAALLPLIVAGALALVGRRANGRFTLGGSRMQVLTLGLAVAVQNVGLCLALSQLGVALTAVVLGAMPLFSTLTGQVWGLDRITGLTSVGLAAGFVGLLLVVAFPAQGDSWAFIAGCLAALLSALAAAFATRYAALRLGGSPAGMASGHVLAALITVPVVLFAGSTVRAGLGGFLTLGLVGLLAAGIGPLFGTEMPHGRPGRATALKTAGILVAVAAGIALVGERISGAQVFGMLLMMAGTLLVLELVPSPLFARWRR
jgi:drug/metabolite transporter (DMT)-like permease